MAESGMPTTYETTTTTSTSTLGFYPTYFKTVHGILKCVEILLDLIVLICASILYRGYYHPPGAGWVQFVAATTMIVTILLLIFHLTNIIYKLPGPWVLIEFIIYCVCTGFYLIAAIVAASYAPQYGGIPSMGAAAFFAFAATVVYAVDTFFQFRNWRSGTMTTTTASSTHTTTTTVVASEKAEY